MSSDKTINLFFRQKMLPLILALLSVLLLATGFVFSHKKVTVVADGTTQIVNTLHSKPEEILAEVHVSLGSQDEVRLSTPRLQEGTVLTVYRAVPVTVVCQQETKTVMTAKPTVGELAASLGYQPEAVKTLPGPEAPVTANMQVQFILLSEKLVEREVSEPFPIIRQPDATMEKGVERVMEAGEDGKKRVTVRLHFADGVEVSAEQVSEIITEAPKPQVVHVGTRDMVATSRGDMRFSRVIAMEATAYLPTDGSPQGLTAMGIPARRGVVAVDPEVIPLGTRVYVPGYGTALAADVGGAIEGNRIDLCIEDAAEAWRFGRRSVKVYVLE